MDNRFEIARAVSMLRSMVRGEIESCVHAIDAGDTDRVRREISGLEDKLKRTINVLNCLR